MFGTMIIVLCGIGSIGTIIGVVANRDPEVRAMFGGLFAISSILGAVVTAVCCTTIVGAADIGVPVSLGHAGTPLSSGVHLKTPWTTVYTLPRRPLPVDDMTVKARTQQAGQVTVTIGGRWHVDPDHATDTYLQVRTGDESRISREIVQRAVGQVVGEVYAGLDNITATKDRISPPREIKEQLTQSVARYGVVIDDVYLRAVEPDAKTSDSLARYAAQQAETQIAEEAQKTAAKEARRRQIEAGGLKAAAGSVPRISDQQVQLLCAQSWERMAAKAISAGVALYTSPCTIGQVVPQAQK